MVVADLQHGARQDPERLAEMLGAARDLYLADVSFMDGELDELLKRLEDDERRFATHVFVTADHGESFGENGVLAHGTRLSAEQIRVPLVVRSPLVAAGVDHGPTGSIDVANAMLTIAGLEATEPSTLLTTESNRPVFGMRQTFIDERPERRTDERVVIPPAMHFYCVIGERVYRGNSAGVSVDDSRPADEQPAETIRTFFESFERSLDGSSPEDVVDEEALKALRALGYLD